MRNPKLLEFSELGTVRGRHPGLKIVHCHGVFDVLHAGHLAYFKSAKKFGDKLVVTVTADEFVNKGPGRPYFNSVIRAEMIAALEVVDYVAVSKFPTAVPSITELKPHFYVKGPDYKDMSKDVSGAIFAEEQAAEQAGGHLVFTDDETHSSSSLLNKFFQPWSEDQQQCIATIQRLGGLAMIESYLDKVAHESVNLIGEPIVDTYVFCQPENISSKSPSISAKFLYQEDYAGGILAVGNHLADFVKDVRLFTTHGGESYFENLLQERLDSRIHIHAHRLPNVPTPRKTRFIASEKAQRIFELTDLRSDQWMNNDPAPFCSSLLKNCHPNAVSIVGDFGHGLFEGPVLQAVGDLSGFIALNVQTNSSNFGFNPYTKHKKCSYLSIDTKEARVAYHDRFSAPIDLARKVQQDLQAKGSAFSMTLGSGGAFHFGLSSKKEYYSPAFADTVVDATGAGDAFFALTSMFVKVGCPPEIIPFVGNVFAGLKAKIIGNKTAVSKAQFIKALTSILK